MKYFLMTVSILLSASQGIVLKKFGNKTIKNTGDLFFFNGGVSVVWTTIMLAWFLISNGTTISLTALIFGLVYSIILCSFLYFKVASLAVGSVTITTLIGSAAFVPATIFGVFYVPENISTFQIIGMGLMLVAVIVCINTKTSAQKPTLKWAIYCTMFFVAGSALGAFFKVFGKSNAFEEVNGMMLSASIFSAVIFFLMGIVYNNPFNRNNLDQIGFAGAVNKLNKSVNGTGTRSVENVLEAYYAFGISDFMTITPDVQFYINPGANQKSNTATIASVRATMMF
jgi:hypothetical protein